MGADVLLSCVVPTKGRPEFLARLVGSLCAQPYGAWELVIEDASTEPVALGFEDDPRIRYRHAPGTSITEALNIGLDRSSGEVLHFACDDDLVPDSAIRSALAGLEHAPWVFGRHEFLDRSGNTVMVRGDVDFDLNHMLKVGNMVPQTSVYWRRELLVEAGPFDEHPDRQLASDYDYWLRLAGLALPWRVPETIGLTTVHPGSITVHSSDLQEEHAERVRRRHLAAWPALPSPVGR